jgi:hypothetical protein
LRRASGLVSLVSFVSFCWIYEASGGNAAHLHRTCCPSGERYKVVIRNFIIAVLIVLVIVVGYLVWNRTRGNVFGDGAITEQNTSSSNDQTAMNSGVTTDPSGNDAHPTTSRSDDPGTINTVPTGSTSSQSSVTPSTPNNPTMGTPMAANTPSPAPSPITAPGGLTSRSNRPVLGPGGPLPASDSIAPNPPNHVGFGGTGKYMWYRQGDLTWRVDSNTGASCVAFATMQEWAKPIVYQNGCDSRRG